ncbi:hypothetical protein G6F65_021606 [Rhizopus arrhizus]|nr:hypothetical protein G6F65_021606 [Rhizopus arrhizus]
MRQPVRVGPPLCHSGAQPFGNARQRAVPASGNARPAMQETRAVHIGSRRTDGGASRLVENHIHTGGRAHADGVPTLRGDSHARLVQRYGGQARFACAVPTADDRVA